MKPALLLIDLQHDYLGGTQVQPSAGAIIDRAATLLHLCRQKSIPVLHVWTTVQQEPDNRMPHWKSAGKWSCLAGSPGHATPSPLQPLPSETIIHKQFFSAFGNPQLESTLRSLQCDTVILAGVYLHACVRATALDAYQRGFDIRIADDAVGSDDPLHSAITRRFLIGRGMRFGPVDQILSDGPAIDSSNIDPIVTATRARWPVWRDTTFSERSAALLNLGHQLGAVHEELARQISADIGKPISMARAEVIRSIAICRATAGDSNGPEEIRTSPKARFRHQPLGTIAAITPWNNPLAIPIGRIAPALFHGNAVVWKPAPAAARIAQRVVQLIQHACPQAAIGLCLGDHTTARELAAHPGIDGVTLSGSLAAGYAIQDICARRSIPFQAEMGGNNAAIVWNDTNLPRAAGQIATGAFGFAGQRCTANRRVIVADSIFDSFFQTLTQATATLPWGDPADPQTVIGPLISLPKRNDVLALLARARETGCRVIVPHESQANHKDLCQSGPYLPPHLVVADDPVHEIVQEETFGPVLVVQRARDFDHALELLNGVRQGLVAALFSDSTERQSQFLRDAHAGVLKLNQSTVDADAVSPLCGWKASGIGPAEHGPSDREFFCRVQTIYDG